MLYTIFSFLNSGISFLLILLLAKYLTPTDYGSLTLFNTFVTLLNVVIALCTTAYITVSFFQKSHQELQKVILVAFATTTVMLIITALSFILFPHFVEKTVGVPIEYLWLGLLICYFGIFNSVNLDIWRLEEKPVTYGVYSVTFAVCNFILSFWIIVGLKFGWQGRVYAWFILGVIYFVVSLIFLVKRRYLVISSLSFKLFKETYAYALPLLPHTTSFWLKQGLDSYIINYIHGQGTVGYYSFAMNLAAIIGVVGTAFNATNSVYIFKRLTEGYEKVKIVLLKQTKLMTIAFFGVSCSVAIFAFCLTCFLIPSYKGSIQYLIPLCLAGFFQCIYLLWVNYLFYYKKTKQLMHITLSTAVLQVILSVWLTPYSALNTAIISMVINALTMLLVKYKSKKTLAMNYNT